MAYLSYGIRFVFASIVSVVVGRILVLLRSVVEIIAVAFKDALPSPETSLFLSAYDMDGGSDKSRFDAFEQRALAHKNFRAGHFSPARSLC